MSRIKNAESVAPYYGQRVERAMRCRHGLSHTERQVLVVLAMRCEKAKPTEGDRSVDYIAQIAGYGPRCVNNALKVLVAKKLIRRVIAGAYDERRRTIMDWNLIQREPFVYLPRPSKANLKAQDEALESFENVPPTDTEMEDSETDMAEMAEVHDVLAVRPETAKQPKTQATPKTRAKLVFDDSHLDIEEPVKENTLTEIAKNALDVLLPQAQRFGAVYPFIEVNGEAWF
jgi:DNA-binding MarR family transcriptional regulator